MAELTFRLDLRDPGSHRARVRLTIPASILTACGGELFLPTWTPGSYLVREYFRSLGSFEVRDAATGAPVPWRRQGKNALRLDPPDGSRAVQVDYEVYAHDLSVRGADLTADHAFLNGACVFLWPRRAGVDAEVELLLPPTWQVATALPRSSQQDTRLQATGLDELLDAPILAGELQLLRFEVLGVPHEIALDGLGGVVPPPQLVDDVRGVVAAAADVFGGGLPYPEYRFLAMFDDRARGGLEHTACCALLAPRTTFRPGRAYRDFLTLVAHEHFHAWNVKRMRPVEFWRYDYEAENHTELLWVAEGLTAYYDDLLCVRAGVLDESDYFGRLAQQITAMHGTPGRLAHPLAAASHDAWIKYYRPDEDSRNSTQSYYSHGALAGLCLDLTIRDASAGARSLDDALAALYRTTFVAGRGYTHGDVVACLGEAAGRDLTDLVEALVHGPFDPPLDDALARCGLDLVEDRGTAPHLGVGLEAAGRELRVASVLRDSPAMRAGVSPGDELLAVNGLRVHRDTWADVVASVWREGDPIRVLLARRGQIREVAATPVARGQGWRIRPRADASDAQRAQRDGWLRGRRDLRTLRAAQD